MTQVGWVKTQNDTDCHVIPVGAKRKMEGFETLRFFPAMEEGAEERAQWQEVKRMKREAEMEVKWHESQEV